MPESDTLPVTGWWAEYVVSGVGGILSGEAFGAATVASFQPVFPSAIASAEAFGTPGLVFRQSVSPVSIESLEAFGGSALNPGDIAILPQHVGSGEAFGTPAVSPGVATVSPPAIVSGEAFGAMAIGTGPVSVDAEAIGSTEAFGTPVMVSVISPSGIASEQAFGLPLVTINVNATGVGSAEGFGVPNVVGPPQAIQPTGVASLEAFGGSGLDPGPISVLPQGVSSAEACGTATIGVGPVSVAPTGAVSGEAFGTARFTEYLAPSGIPSQEAFGASRIDQTLTVGSGIGSGEAFGTPTVATASAVPVSFIGVNSAHATNPSVTIPTHQVGDEIVLFVYYGGGATVPTKPAASGTVPAWVDVDSLAANTNASRIVRFRATATNTTSGTWSGAGDIIAVVLRGTSASSPVGGEAMSSGQSNAAATCPSVTLARTDGSSVILQFAGVSFVSTFTAPSGYTKRTTDGGTGSQASLCTKNSTTSDGSVAYAFNSFGASSFFQSATVEFCAY